MPPADSSACGIWTVSARTESGEGEDVGETGDVEDFLDGRLRICDLHRLARHLLLGGQEDAKTGRRDVVDLREIKDELSLYNACEAVLDKGLQRIFVSLGSKGCLYMDQEGRMLRRQLRPP